jgi:hypothetical protein
MNTATLPSLTFAGLLLSGAGAYAAPETDAADAERVTRSAQGFARDHADDELRSLDAFAETRTAPADVVTKPRDPTTGTTQGKTNGATVAAAVLGDSYVYDATTDLFYDNDGDGYFHHLRVRFDADTLFDTSWIYARIFVSADGNSWEQVFETDDFVIHGSDPDDDYEVETDLVSGYSAALYDVLIELYDADDGTLVDEFGPNESSDFSLLPLEDAVRDGVEPAPGPIVDGDGGGGAVSWLTLPFLLGALAWVRRPRSARSRG